MSEEFPQSRDVFDAGFKEGVTELSDGIKRLHETKGDVEASFPKIKRLCYGKNTDAAIRRMYDFSQQQITPLIIDKDGNAQDNPLIPDLSGWLDNYSPIDERGRTHGIKEQFAIVDSALSFSYDVIMHYNSELAKIKNSGFGSNQVIDSVQLMEGQKIVVTKRDAEKKGTGILGWLQRTIGNLKPEYEHRFEENLGQAYQEVMTAFRQAREDWERFKLFYMFNRSNALENKHPTSFLPAFILQDEKLEQSQGAILQAIDKGIRLELKDHRKDLTSLSADVARTRQLQLLAEAKRNNSGSMGTTQP